MYLNTFKAQFLKYDLKLQIKACTEKEISSSEQQLGLLLPIVYREFLLWGGYEPHRLLDFSDCNFSQLSSLQEYAVELLAENNFPESLPKDAFIFCFHQGYQFMFFKISEGQNPPVYFYGEGQKETYFLKVYESFSECLIKSLARHYQFQQDDREFLEEQEKQKKLANFWQEQYAELANLLEVHFNLLYISDDISIEGYLKNTTYSRYLEVINQIKTVLSIEPFPFEELKYIFSLQEFFQDGEQAKVWLKNLLNSLETVEKSKILKNREN